MIAYGRPRVCLVSRHALLTDCLASALERRGFDTLSLVVPPGSGVTAVDHAAREALAFGPRVVIVHWDLAPHRESNALLALLDLLSARSVAVLVLTKERDESEWGAYLVRGAWAVVPMTASLTSACATVRHLAAGTPEISRAERDRLIAAYRTQSCVRHQERARLATLSVNEVEILRLLMAGCSPTEVARLRTVSVSTVRTQVKWILSKLAVSSQLAAVASAHRAGWAAAGLEHSVDI